MTAREMIIKLSKVPGDTPVYAMGAKCNLYFVTGDSHDYVTQEESDSDFATSHHLDGELQDNPNYAVRL